MNLLTKSLRNKSLLLASLGLAILLSPAPSLGETPPEYKLQPGDQLHISVWREEELQDEVLIRPDGKFTFPLAGEVAAAGRTPAEIQSEVTSKLQTYIPEAVVTLTVTGIEGNRIYVIGQVEDPGAFVMNPRMNVLQALSLAGGMTPFASSNDIVVLRGAGPDQKTLSFRYDDVARGRDLDQNIMLEAGDVIIVP